MRSKADSVKAVVQMLLGVFFFGLPSAYGVDVNIKITGEIYIPPAKSIMTRISRCLFRPCHCMK